MTKAVNLVLIIMVLGVFCVPGIFAQTSEISYQGSLKDGTTPANGNYDIEFRLYSAATGGSLIGTEIYLSPVAVTDGVFSVKLDFGASSFPGLDRYLEVAVRRTGVGSLMTLGPRQKIGSAPYAVQSLQAATATQALIASNAQALGGVNAAQYIVNTDTRLTDSRMPLGGSTNYIQNTGSQQANSNFNVSGTGTAGILSATSRFNFGNQHVLSAPGLDNIFAGSVSGLLLTSGNNNAFFGAKAGQENKSGSFNAFFGAYAGQNNSSGINNSFFGYFAGNGTTSGSDNSFFGNRAGQVNTTGAFNSFFGTFSGLFNSTGSDNSFFGNETGWKNTSGNRNSFFGSKAGHENTIGEDNAFLGSFAGANNTQGTNNSFVGSLAGQGNLTGTNNSFMGSRAGHDNTASNNSFFGTEAGRFNTSGANNTFLGRNAGRDNTVGELNVFVGVNAGNTNTLGRFNTIIGAEADVLGTNLQYATAIGAEAIVNTSNTVVLGRPADTVRVPGDLTVQGTLNATTLSIGATNITGVIGTANGGTGLSSPGMAGRFLRSDGTNWTSAPFTVADIPSGSGFYIQNSTTQQGSTNFNISGNGTVGGTLSGNAVNSITQYNIGGQRVLSTVAGSGNLFAGVSAGNANTTGGSNSFFGSSAGAGNSSGSNNSFFGTNAGLSSSAGGNNTFAGASSGSGNSTGGNNSFFGVNAGQTNSIGGNNTVIGANANVGSNNLAYATAIGADAVVSTNNTVVLGRNVDTVRVPGNLQVDGLLSANNFSIPASNLTGTVAVANGGTGMSSPGVGGNFLRSNGSIWQTSPITVADIPAGSGNYIQNGTGQQTGASFNIGGNGTIVGSLTVNGAINGSLAASNITGTVPVLHGGTGLTSAGSSGHFLKSKGVGFATAAITASDITGTLGTANGGTGVGASGAPGNVLRSNGSVWASSPLQVSDIPSLGAAYIQNSGSPQAGANFNIGGNGTVGGNLTVIGAFNGNISASNITGTLGIGNGGTGLTSAGTSGHFLRSTGAGFATAPLAAGDIPSLAASYIQNSGSLQGGATFNIGGNGTIGGNLTVGGAISGNVAASNISGAIGVGNGGTGLSSAGTSGHFLKSTGSGFTTAPLAAGDIPSLASGYIQNNPGGPQAGASFNIGGSGTIGTNLNVTGNLTVGGSFSVPASNITGTLGIGSGGTGLNAVGTSGHFLKSNGTGLTYGALGASDIPAGSTSYVQNGTGAQSGASFNVAGSGAVGTAFSVGADLSVGGNATVTGNLTVNGSFNVPAANITGTLGVANGGTGLASAGTSGHFLKSTGSGFTTAALSFGDITLGTLGAGNGGTGLTGSTGTQFLRGNGSGGWTSGALAVSDIPSLGGTYIQNGTTPQTASLNITGDATAAGNVSGSAVNAITEYRINGNRVFATTGTDNIFAGEGAGNTGGQNSFFGRNAGNTNSAGSNNTVIGANADVGSGNLQNATAIGANAEVTQSNSLVLGGINGVNGGADTSVGIGTTAPKAKLDVKGNIYVSDPGQGVILRPASGTTCTLIKADGSGGLTVSSITCP